MTDSRDDGSMPDFAVLRAAMLRDVEAHATEASGYTHHPTISPRVLGALGSVARHEFVPLEMRPLAYLDSPVPIGFDKTVSQPYIVALMTDLLEIADSDRVLDVGTGLGYQAAVLSRLAARVSSVELIGEFAASASRRLREQGCDNVEVRHGDGRQGWAEHAPFDKILVAAAPDLIPSMLIEQLEPGGRMVIPAGLARSQQLMLVEKDRAGRTHTRDILAVRFSALE